MSVKAGQFQYKPPPRQASGTLPQQQDILEVVQNLYRGKIQCTGEITLAASTSVTIVKNEICSNFSTALLSPFSAQAATEITSTYASAYTQGQFTLTHANTTSTTRVYRYALIG